MATKRTTRARSDGAKARTKRAATGRTARAGTTRAGTTRGRAPDALSLLQDDHKRVKSLFRRFRSMQSDDPQLPEVVEQACMELEIHASLEEELFYPAVRECIRQSELVDEAEVEHQSARQLIAQLRQLDADDPKYAATFSVLAEYVQHHLQVEEKEIFPRVRRARIDLAGMAAELQARRQELTSPEGEMRWSQEEGADSAGRMPRDQGPGRARDVARH